jgi:hypothetical protein
MANGFLQNSFRVGTPARGGGDILTALLGINTNPDVQVKGQLAGARLGNLDSRTRRSNILGNQDQIRLEDMETIRKFITPEGDGSGGLNPQFQAMAQGSDYAGGQRGLATRQKRINLEEGLAELSEGGYMMEINGQEVPLATVLKSMSGADFKNLATTNPAIKKLMSQIKGIDLRSADTHDLSKLQQIESENRNLNIKARGEILDTQKLTAASREKIAAIDLKVTEFMEFYTKKKGVLDDRTAQKQLDKLALELKISEKILLGMKGKSILNQVMILQGIAKIQESSGGAGVSDTKLFSALKETSKGILDSLILKDPAIVKDKKFQENISAAALAIVGAHVKNLKGLQEQLHGKPGEKKAPGFVAQRLSQIISQMTPEDANDVMGVLDGTLPGPPGQQGQPGLSANQELANREKVLKQPLTGPPPSDAGVVEAITGSGIAIDSTGNLALQGQGQTDPASATASTDIALANEFAQPQLPETAPVTVTGRDKVQQDAGAFPLRFKPADLEAMTQAMPNEMPTIQAALAAGDIDGLLGLAQDYRDATPPELAKAELIEDAVKNAMGDAKLGVR